MLSYFNELQQAASHLSREQWIGVSVGVLIVGAFFLRGFGLRSGY